MGKGTKKNAFRAPENMATTNYVARKVRKFTVAKPGGYEEGLKAENLLLSDSGALVFHTRDELVMAFAPGCWERVWEDQD